MSKFKSQNPIIRLYINLSNEQNILISAFLSSIIKIFCIENVKSEIRKANLIYTESFGNKVCDCYLKNIKNNIEHEKSIFKCKEDANKQLDSNLKE